MDERDLLPFESNEPYHYGYDKPVTDWLIRVERRRNIYDRLKQLGKLAVLGLTSILTGYEDGQVAPLAEETNSKSVFKQSYMFKQNSRSVNKAILALETEHYERAQEAYQSFMIAVTLSIRELNDRATLECFNTLKLWVYRHMTSPGHVDQVCNYLKWLLKACQMLFLGKEIPLPESWFPTINGLYHPFQTGELAFLQEFFEARKLTRRLTVPEISIVVQLANGIRAMPYPSKRQMQESITKTLGILSNPERIDIAVREQYKIALSQIKLRLGPATERRTHVSLTSSACLENPQSKGGKATYKVLKMKAYLAKPAKKEVIKPLEGLRDHLGDPVFLPGISDFIKEGHEILDLCYLHPDDAVKYLDKVDISKERVPYDYGRCILLVSSIQLNEDKLGTYLGIIENPLKIPLFKGKTKFIPNVETMKVKASLVQEKGMKSRVVTTTHEAKAQIEQAFSNMVREYLSKDPFHRVGFDEADKLWETLKAYQRAQTE